jgi:hypothetical protein
MEWIIAEAYPIQLGYGNFKMRTNVKAKSMHEKEPSKHVFSICFQSHMQNSTT